MTNMRIEEDDEFDSEEDEEYEWEDEEDADELAYKILSGSESKVERELNILSQEGWTIDEMSAFDSNNGTIVVLVMSIVAEGSFQLEIDRANSLLYP
tara:strand:- start:25581 stop:25871 length:291 start_codon:yes stop_codon:yes gene_type:complete